MIERTLLRTDAESATEAAGASLASSLHRIPVTIGVSGPLGSGKTAFMRGFIRGMGMDGPVVSPTYALEQRYHTHHGDVAHLDLYRLSEAEAAEILRSSDGDADVRCVEWPERAGKALSCGIDVNIDENRDGSRAIAILFRDVAWPSDAAIETWRNDVRLPAHLRDHCEAVAALCMKIADALAARGTVVRREFLRAAAKTHDLFRFVDFRPEGAPAEFVAHEREVWEEWKRTLGVETHEEAIHVFLRKRGFGELGRVTAEHSLHFPMERRLTTESRTLYYADKRVMGSTVVDIEGRYADFAMRYSGGSRTDQSLRWEQDTRDTERLLFPGGAPF